VLFALSAQTVFAQSWSFGDLFEAFENLSAEAAERVSASPARIVPLLADSLQSGETNLHFAFNDRWSDYEIDFTLLSNAAERDFVLQLEFLENDSDWEPFTFKMDVYFNPERIAFSSPLLDADIFGDYIYGLNFATYSDEIWAFMSQLAAAFGEELDYHDYQAIMRDIQLAYVWQQALNFEIQELEVDFSAFMPYMGAFMQLMLSAEFSVETADGLTRKGVTLSDTNAFAVFFSNLADILEADDDMRMVHGALRDMGFFWTRYDRMVEDIRWAAEDLNDSYINFYVEFALYISENNRLSKIELNIHDYWEGESEAFVQFSVCFGDSAYGAWTFFFLQYEPGFATDSVTLTWDFAQIGGTYTHRFTSIEHSDWEWRDGYLEWVDELIFTWNPATGEFLFSSPDYDETFAGIFTADEYGNFYLRFEYTDRWYGSEWIVNDDGDWERVSVLREDHTAFALSGTPTVEIPARQFVNVGELDAEFVARAVEFFENLFT
jgi:hypothetical protein